MCCYKLCLQLPGSVLKWKGGGFSYPFSFLQGNTDIRARTLLRILDPQFNWAMETTKGRAAREKESGSLTF